jgi:hypothetical protein
MCIVSWSAVRFCNLAFNSAAHASDIVLSFCAASPASAFKDHLLLMTQCSVAHTLCIGQFGFSKISLYRASERLFPNSNFQGILCWVHKFHFACAEGGHALLANCWHKISIKLAFGITTKVWAEQWVMRIYVEPWTQYTGLWINISMRLQRNLRNNNLKVTILSVATKQKTKMTRISVVTIYSQSMRPWPLLWMWVTSCHNSPLTSSAPDGGCK